MSALLAVAAFAATAMSDHVGLSVLLIGLIVAAAVVKHQVREGVPDEEPAF